MAEDENEGGEGAGAGGENTANARARIYIESSDTKNRAGDYDGAIADCNEAFILGPDKEIVAEVFHSRGRAYGRLGNYEAAISDFDDVLRINPNDTSTLHDRALAMAFRRTEKDYKNLVAKTRKQTEKDRAELIADIRKQMEKQFGNLEVDTEEWEKRAKKHTLIGGLLGAGRVILLIIWFALILGYGYGLYLEAFENLKDNPLALLPWLALLSFLSVPIIWLLNILGQRILERKILAADMHRRATVEKRIPLLAVHVDDDARKIEFRSYFGSWMTNSPAELLIELNAKRIGIADTVPILSWFKSLRGGRPANPE